MKTSIIFIAVSLILCNVLLSNDCIRSDGVYTSVKHKCLLQASGINLIHTNYKSYFSNNLNWFVDGTQLNDSTIVLVLPDSNSCKNSFIFLTQSNQIKQITHIQNMIKDTFNMDQLNTCKFDWTTANTEGDIRIEFPKYFQYINQDTILQFANIFDANKSIGTILLLYQIDKNGDVHQIKEKALKGLVCVGQDEVQLIMSNKNDQDSIVLCLEKTENKFNLWSIFNFIPFKNAPKKWNKKKIGRYLYFFDSNLNVIKTKEIELGLEFEY